MKKCPYCAEEIQDEAIKCRYCMEFLNRPPSLSTPPPLSMPPPRESQTRWYFKKSFIIMAILCVGPLALPLVWWHPSLSRGVKIGLTAAILALTWVLTLVCAHSIKMLKEYYKFMESMTTY